MTGSIAESGGHIVGAVAFDERTDAVCATVTSFCKRFAMAATMVNIVDLLKMRYLVATEAFPGQAVFEELLATEASQSEKQLSALVAKLQGECPAISCKMVVGNALGALLEQAKLTDASLVVVGCHPRVSAMVPAGMTVALGLMQSSPVPVLAIVDRPVDPAGGALRILVADDLTRESAAAVQEAYSLAASARAGTRLRHLHLSGTPSKTHGELTGELLARGEPQRTKAAGSGLTPELEIERGDATAGLREAIDDFDPDVIVFGRHRWLHAHPFYIGRLPFHAMVRTRRAVLIVPST